MLEAALDVTSRLFLGQIEALRMMGDFLRAGVVWERVTLLLRYSPES